MITEELQAWYEWEELCAVERCSEGAKRFLNDFGDRALSRGISKLPEEVRDNILRPSEMPGYGFCLLEKYALEKVYTERQPDKELREKTYKKGIFYKQRNSQDPPLQVLKAQARCMMRNAAREWWKEEMSIKGGQSLEVTTSTNCDLTLIDLLPDTYQYEDSDLRELLEIAREEAPDIFKVIPFVQRVILIARKLGIPYSNSDVIKRVTDKSTSSLGYQFKYLYKRKDYLQILKEKYPKEDPETMDLLYRMVLAICGEMAIEWGRSEKMCDPIFIEAEAGQQDNAS